MTCCDSRKESWWLWWGQEQVHQEEVPRPRQGRFWWWWCDTEGVDGERVYELCRACSGTAASAGACGLLTWIHRCCSFTSLQVCYIAAVVNAYANVKCHHDLLFFVGTFLAFCWNSAVTLLHLFINCGMYNWFTLFNISDTVAFFSHLKSHEQCWQFDHAKILCLPYNFDL